MRTSSPSIIPDATPSYARTALSVGVLAVLYLWIFPYHGGINNPNENVRVYMTVAMVDDHTFAINRIESDWGYTNDKATRNNKLYSSKAPGTSYLGVPAYWLLTHLTHRDSHPLTPAQIHAHHRPPLERTLVVYALRLWTNVLPALLFAWFWHRFLGSRTRVPALREAVFFSTMAGSLLFAYSEVFVSHANNALAAMAALMALAVVRDEDRMAELAQRAPPYRLGLMATAGFFGAAATMFEYPAAIATFGVALLILATAVERRAWFVYLALALVLVAAKVLHDGHKRVAIALVGIAAINYALTLSWRSLARLALAGLGAAIPTGLTLFYHKRCFGDPFKPGYSFLENPQFRAETNQGFFGATSFSWESAIRLWLDPAFGLIPSTAILIAALAGFGAYFAWQPPRRAVWPVRGALAALAIACAYKAALAAEAIKTANWQGPASQQASWLAWLMLVLLALMAVTLRRPTRSDAGLAATMLLICIGLSRLIGMMNNWRGGWQVGPRYLATLAPMVGLAALAGLDSIAQRSTTHRRVVTVFAAGATLHAMIVSGIPSAFFPHIPTEFVSPVFELFIPLLRDGYVPRNAGRFWFHWQGMKGMIPFFIAAAVAAVIVLRGDERRPLAIGAHMLAGAAVMLVLLTPFAATAKYESSGVTRWVKGIFEPRPAEEHTPPPGAPPAAAVVETPDALRTRARHMAESGDTNGAFETYRRAMQWVPPAPAHAPASAAPRR